MSGNGLGGAGLLSARIKDPWWLTDEEIGLEEAISTVLFYAGLGALLLLVTRRRGLIIPARAFHFEAIGPYSPVDTGENGTTPPSCPL